MVTPLHEWVPLGKPGSVHDVTEDGAWEALAEQYSHAGSNLALKRIFEVAQGHGVVCIVREYRYIDADWRSQLGKFFLGTFKRYPSVCHRLHFFTRQVPEQLVDLSGYQDAYKGYTVLRPLPVSPVGRTMIAPPAELAAEVVCVGTETVDLFGWPLSITAMPFISQDTQLMRCAHSAVWMVLTLLHLVHGLPYRLPREIHEASQAGNARVLPSDGLSPQQLLSTMSSFGLSPARKPLPRSQQASSGAGTTSLHGIICRYLNSSLPPVVISDTHAWTLVGWTRGETDGHPFIRLWRHDDVRGPYLPVEDPWQEPDPAHHPWLSAFVPLLPKAHLDAESAEEVGIFWRRSFRKTDRCRGTTLDLASERDEIRDQVAHRTFLMRAKDFKQDLVLRGVPDPLAAGYRLAAMPRYIWVVELVDRMRRRNGEPDVIGEILLDSTTTQFEPRGDPNSILAFHADDFAFVCDPDLNEGELIELPKGTYYVSACRLLRVNKTGAPPD